MTTNSVDTLRLVNFVEVGSNDPLHKGAGLVPTPAQFNVLQRELIAKLRREGQMAGKIPPHLAPFVIVGSEISSGVGTVWIRRR